MFQHKRLAIITAIGLVLASFWIWENFVRVADPSLVNGRLPSHVRPLHYKLRLYISPEKEDFQGEALIDLQTSERIDELYLHAQDLRFTEIATSADQKNWDAAVAKPLSTSGLTSLKFEDSIAPGRFQLKLKYIGRYTKNNEGLWRQRVNEDWYVFNQFNSIFARRAVPGFDEPGIRNTFELEVIAPSWHHVVSNNPLIDTHTLAESLKRVRFSVTPPISLHQLNISVGPFDIIPGNILKPNDYRRSNLPIRAVALKGQGTHARYALSQIGRMVEEAEAYFGMPFPFEKLDVIAVPNSSEGVLEHPGAINLRDRIMLFDSHHQQDSERLFLSFFTHGLIHHWVGNLVAMDWWSDVWLYEGMSEWLTYRLLEKVYPELHFEIDRHQARATVMNNDVNSPKPLRPASIVSDADIHTVYDASTTSKSAALIRMLERFVREDRFQSRLKSFFARHAYDLANGKDLFEAVVDSVSQPELGNNLDHFVSNPGLPVIHFRRECQNQRLKIHLRQLTQIQEPQANSAWTVPVCIRFLSDQQNTQCVVISENEYDWQTIMPCRASFVPNADAAGYYRWTIEQNDWPELIAKTSKLSTVEAMEVADNLSYGFNNGQITAQQYWALAPTLGQHASPVVSEQLLNDGEFFLYRATPVEHIATTRQWFIRMPWINDQTQTELLKRFYALEVRDAKFRDRITNIISDVRSLESRQLTQDPIALAVLLEEHPAWITKFTELLCHETRGEIRADIVKAMSMIREPKAHKIALSAMTNQCIGNNEQWVLLQRWLASPPVQNATYEFVVHHFEELKASQPAFRITELAAMSGYFCDMAEFNSVREFLSQKLDNTPGVMENFENARTRTERCVALKNKHNPLNLH